MNLMQTCNTQHSALGDRGPNPGQGVEKSFDDDFISLAGSVYFRNDERQINLKFGSNLVEEKQYTSY